MHVEEAESVSKVIVISDTHFGDEGMLLGDHGLVDSFASALADRGDISELILLGDIVDLWLKTPVPALRDAHYFLDAISRLRNVRRIVYVPGNHDHQIFLDAFRLEMDTRIKAGDLSLPRFMPARRYDESVLRGLAHPGTGVKFPMSYPFLVRNVGGHEVVFTHGHHLDFYASSFGWARTFWLGRCIIKKRRKKATLHDIEMANIPFCGAMSDLPWAPELVVKALRYYRIISFFGKLFRSKRLRKSPLRDSLIKANYEEISLLLPQLDHPSPACFVFGHTHRPGIGRNPETGVLVANSGSWVEADDEGVPLMTWLEVGSEVELYSLESGSIELIDSSSINPEGGPNGVP